VSAIRTATDGWATSHDRLDRAAVLWGDLTTDVVTLTEHNRKQALNIERLERELRVAIDHNKTQLEDLREKVSESILALGPAALKGAKPRKPAAGAGPEWSQKTDDTRVERVRTGNMENVAALGFGFEGIPAKTASELIKKTAGFGNYGRKNCPDPTGEKRVDVGGARLNGGKASAALCFLAENNSAVLAVLAQLKANGVDPVVEVINMTLLPEGAARTLLIQQLNLLKFGPTMEVDYTNTPAAVLGVGGGPGASGLTNNALIKLHDAAYGSYGTPLTAIHKNDIFKKWEPEGFEKSPGVNMLRYIKWGEAATYKAGWRAVMCNVQHNNCKSVAQMLESIVEAVAGVKMLARLLRGGDMAEESDSDSDVESDVVQIETSDSASDDDEPSHGENHHSAHTVSNPLSLDEDRSESEGDEDSSEGEEDGSEDDEGGSKSDGDEDGSFDMGF